ncbi:MAG: FAD-dependent oxidoreductase, partial [Clostridia bacterium]|nr:FAD-dependent oxidoreductase [Clostridia bacterium]
MKKVYDVIIIGGGVIGTAILRKLSRYNISSLLIEKEDDVSCGASRANSGIVHAGYDCEPHTSKAYFNVEGNKMYEDFCKELDVPYKKTGSLVVAPDSGIVALKALYNKGLENKVKVELIGRERIKEIEPNVADGVTQALYAKNAGIVSPYKLTIALADSAVLNGAEVMLSTEVTDVVHEDGIYKITTTKGKIESRLVINAAGANCMKINAMLHDEVHPVCYAVGEYFVLDSTEGANINTVIFPLPDENGKGIL